MQPLNNQPFTQQQPFTQHIHRGHNMGKFLVNVTIKKVNKYNFYNKTSPENIFSLTQT